MTTPEIAGLCERLDGAYERQNNARDRETITLSKDTLERQAAEIERLRSAGRVTPRLRLVRNFLLAAAAVALPIIGLVEMLLPR
jgi:hypothetical protein